MVCTLRNTFLQIVSDGVATGFASRAVACADEPGEPRRSGRRHVVELASSRNACPGFSSIGAPCDTGTRFNDSVSAQCNGGKRSAFVSSMIAIFTTLETCADVPATTLTACRK